MKKYLKFKTKSCDRRAKSATKFPLRTYPMRPVDAKFAKYDLRERINTAKINANRLRYTKS